MQEALETVPSPPDLEGKQCQGRLEAFLHLQQGLVHARGELAAGDGAENAETTAHLWLVESSRVDHWGRRRRIPLPRDVALAVDGAPKGTTAALPGGGVFDGAKLELALGGGAPRRLARLPRAALARAGDAAAHAAYAQRMLRDAVRRADGAAVAELVEDEAFPPSWAPALRAWLRGARSAPPAPPAARARSKSPTPDKRLRRSTPSAASRRAVAARASAATDDAPRLLDALGVDADLALQSAVDGGRLDAVLAMLEARPEGRTLAGGGADALLLAAVSRGDAAAVGALVERLGARVDGDPSGAVAPAHVAAGRGDADVLGALKGADLEASRPAEAGGAPRTPLEHAASRGHDDAVDALLDLGAAPSPGALLLAAERAAKTKAGAKVGRALEALVAASPSREDVAAARDVLAAAAAALERRAGDARRGLAALRDRESLRVARGVARTAALGAWDHAVRVLAPAREKLEAARRFLSHLGAPDLAAARNAAGVDAAVRDAASLVAGLDFGSPDLDAARVKRELLARLPAKKAADPLAGDAERLLPPPPDVGIAARAAVAALGDVDAETFLYRNALWAAALWAFVDAALALDGVRLPYETSRKAFAAAAGRHAAAAARLDAEPETPGASAARAAARRKLNDDAALARELRALDERVAPDAGDGSPVRDLTSTLDKIADGAANPFAEGDERRRAAAKASAGPDDRRPADDRRRSFDGRPRRARSEGGGALAGAEGRPRRANSDGDRFASPWPDIISLIEEGPKSRRRRSHDEGPAS